MLFYFISVAYTQFERRGYITSIIVIKGARMTTKTIKHFTSRKTENFPHLPTYLLVWALSDEKNNEIKIKILPETTQHAAVDASCQSNLNEWRGAFALKCFVYFTDSAGYLNILHSNLHLSLPRHPPRSLWIINYSVFFMLLKHKWIDWLSMMSEILIKIQERKIASFLRRQYWIATSHENKSKIEEHEKDLDRKSFSSKKKVEKLNFKNIFVHRKKLRAKLKLFLARPHENIVKRHKVFILFSYLNSFVYTPLRCWPGENQENCFH